MKRSSFAIVGAAVTCLFLISPSGFAATSESPGYDCQQLAGSDAPVDPGEWLERSLWAGHCYAFQARAVRISSDGVRTLALSHEIHAGVEREVASYLDGPAVVYERYGRIGKVDGDASTAANADESLASPVVIMSQLEANYRLSLDGEERIAGRSSVRLDIEPLDNMRYGHRLWLDRKTALPLKQVLIGIDGRILETFQMTELAEPRLHEGAVMLESSSDTASGPWRLGWLPAGYEPLPLTVSHSVTNPPLSHRLYSDGLSSFSLFIEPLTADDEALLPGIHRLGISHAAVRRLRIGDRVMQVVVMGEMPPQVLGRIAARLEYRPLKHAVSQVPP